MTTQTRPDDARANALRDAFHKWNVANEHWVDATLDLASQLKQARDACGGSDTAFGAWLVDNECDELDKNTRAAFLKMAEYPDASRTALAVTHRRSIRHIWETEIRPAVEPRRLEPDLSQFGEGSAAAKLPEHPPPSRPEFLTVSQEERDSARAEAERRQQAAAEAFKADQDARRVHPDRCLTRSTHPPRSPNALA